MLAELSSDLFAARTQMAFTLGSHIIIACFGVGLPILMSIAEYLSLRGDEVWRSIATRWSRAFAVLFAIGAVSGTVLSFELGLLWPGFMGKWGEVIGLPFALEGFAFFIEAIFAGIYLYGWDKLPPRVHWLTSIPIAVSGFLSAWFVVTANAWMNAPAGFMIAKGPEPVNIDPFAAMFNAATWAQTTHMILAAYIVSGFSVASYYGFQWLRGNRTEYIRRAMLLGLWLGCLATPLQLLSGDWCSKVVADLQPAKFAAMEATFETQKYAPLHIGGIPDESRGTVSYAISIPGLLSFMAHGDFSAEVTGLNEFKPEDRPPVAIVHVAFQIMVGLGVYLFFLSAWFVLIRWRKRAVTDSQRFILCLIPAGVAAVIAMEAGWVVTEVGRQPWIVQGHMRTSEAVTGATGLWPIFFVTLAIYAVLFVGGIVSLRYLARQPVEIKGGR